MLVNKLIDMDDEITPLSAPLVAATVHVYNLVSQNFLPTPQKSHYLFNMRDIAKVIQGLMVGHPSIVCTREDMVRLWVHESMRVFSDRLIDADDRNVFKGYLDDRLDIMFTTKWSTLMGELDEDEREAGPLFAQLLESPIGDDTAPPYAEVTQAKRAKLKQHIEEALEDYNVEPGFIPMNLVMFGDAIKHMLRILRIIRTPRGNAMLVGVGGSGRQSLTRLAAFLSEYKVFCIKITKTCKFTFMCVCVCLYYHFEPFIVLFFSRKPVLTVFINKTNPNKNNTKKQTGALSSTTT
jgi:dynein heavy chain